MTSYKVIAMNENIQIDKEWPEGELEYLGLCPVCGCVRRKLLYEGLIDNVAFCAPGKWNLQQCLYCTTAYLDPRPTSASMQLAYRNYYTHAVISKPTSMPLSKSPKLRRALANGYRNWRYGTQTLPATKLGIIAAYILTGWRRQQDLVFRNLPRVWKGARVLDVGFGSGAFMEYALTAGWEVSGVDVDAVVINSAKKRGLNVRQGGIEAFADQPESFDVISMSHVIEHVYDPVETLRMAFKLLKPGGQLWLDTPNLNSFGHALFGISWRGLEPPRHLVLFGSQSIKKALNQAGFMNWKYIDRTTVTQGMFMASKRIRCGMSPYDETYSETN